MKLRMYNVLSKKELEYSNNKLELNNISQMDAANLIHELPDILTDILTNINVKGIEYNITIEQEKENGI